MKLPEELLTLLNQASPCFIATTMPDGSPQMTQTWVDTDGEHIVINTVEGYQTQTQAYGGSNWAVATSRTTAIHKGFAWAKVYHCGPQ